MLLEGRSRFGPRPRRGRSPASDTLALAWAVRVLGGRFDEAVDAFKKSLELSPVRPVARTYIGLTSVLRGKPQEALVEIQKEPEEIWRLYGLAITQHAVKDHKKGDEALAGLIRKHQGGAAYQIAEAYAFRGETDRAFEWLERAYAQRDGGLLNLKVSPFLAGLRPDPRYAALLKRMRLPK